MHCCLLSTISWSCMAWYCMFKNHIIWFEIWKLWFDHFQVVLEAGADRSLDVGNNKVFACGSLSWSLCLRLRNILKRGLTDSNDSNSNDSKFWFKCSQTWAGSFSCNGIHKRYVTYVRYILYWILNCILYTVYSTVYCILTYHRRLKYEPGRETVTLSS
jgi:hypothetical protein